MTVLFKKCTYGLLLIATTIIGLINFGYCDLQVIDTLNIDLRGNKKYSYEGADFQCFVVNYCTNYSYNPDYEFTVGTTPGRDMLVNFNGNVNNTQNIKKGMGYCSDNNLDVTINSNITCSVTFKAYKIVNLSSLECQTEYNLIPISSVDQNYCVNNNLCPSSECPDIPIGTGNRSALYINNIQYNGAPTIRVTIPEEIERDNYTDEEETTIDIIGYGYDQEKMQQMVNTQYYKPTAEEMSGLIEKIADFLPLVAVALLITRLRRVIKKVF